MGLLVGYLAAPLADGRMDGHGTGRGTVENLGGQLPATAQREVVCSGIMKFGDLTYEEIKECAKAGAVGGAVVDEIGLQALKNELRAPDRSIRLAAIDRIAEKRGKGIVLKIDDERVVPLLIEALSDSDRTVQRAAARSLRPWVKKNPDLLSIVLPHYTTDTFSGGYTHVGLYDVEENRILIPRFQASKGHASLLADGNTDKYFKFEFYVPSQAPRRFSDHGTEGDAHLILHVIPAWSYSQQVWIPEFDERRLSRNAREQAAYCAAVVEFYANSQLDCPVSVHRAILATEKNTSYEFCVERMRASGGMR